MLLNTCRFCEHVNPDDAKFCNACGGALHLLPCPSCGAVNDVTATACYQCHSDFPGRKTDVPDPAQPIPENSRSLQRPHFRLAIGAATVTAISILGYYGYSKRWLDDAPRAPSTSSDAIARVSRADTGLIRRDAADCAGAVAALGLCTLRPVENKKSEEPVHGNAEIARARSAADGKAVGQELLRGQTCTTEAAALGLCTPKLMQEGK